MFVNYSYEHVKVKDLNPLYLDPRGARGQPVPRRFAADRRRAASARISKIGPSYVYNTVDNPIFPTTGKR